MGKYFDDLSIDKYELESEIIKQAQLYIEYSEKVEDANAERDRLKQQYDIVRAEVDGEIRSDPSQFGFEKKPTESAISATVTQSERVIEAYNNFLEAKKNAAVLVSVKEAFGHKKKMLELLVNGMVSGIFATPKVNQETQESIEKRVRQRINHQKKLKNIAKEDVIEEETEDELEAKGLINRKNNQQKKLKKIRK